MIKETRGARPEISADGTMRTHRDTREAVLRKAIHPSSKIVIRDLQTGAKIDPQKP